MDRISLFDVCPFRKIVITYFGRIACFYQCHTKKDYYLCTKGCDYNCRLCKHYSLALSNIYACSCNKTFCFFHYLSHYKLSQKYENMSCNSKVFDLSRLFDINLGSKCQILNSILIHLSSNNLIIKGISNFQPPHPRKRYKDETSANKDTDSDNEETVSTKKYIFQFSKLEISANVISTLKNMCRSLVELGIGIT